MPDKIAGKARELIEGANFAHISPVDKSGRPQLNPVWIHAYNGNLVVNSAEGRAWPENVRRAPRITLSVANQENPYEYVTVLGRVVEEDRIALLFVSRIDPNIVPAVLPKTPPHSVIGHSGNRSTL